MSGFEVAGVVLAVLPLVISALEHHRDGVRAIKRWRKYEEELKILIRMVQIQQTKLQNVCEKLLDGLAPPSQIDAMVKDPGGILWVDEEIQAKIRARLWTSWAVFEQTLREIQEAITYIKERMGKESDVRWAVTPAIAKELKRAGFMLRRSTYESRLATVKDGISDLEYLSTTNIELEPRRLARSRVRLLSVLRNLSSSVYRAVCSSLTCACKHGISMHVSDYTDVITPSHSDEYIVQKLQVHLALTLPQFDFDGSLPDMASRQWEELLIRASAPSSTSASTPHSQSVTTSPIISSTKSKKAVRFSLHRPSSSFPASTVQTGTFPNTNLTTAATAATSATAATVATAAIVATAIAATAIAADAIAATATAASIQPSINICNELQRSPATERFDCLGMISDQLHIDTRSYSVYSSTLSPLNENGCRMVSLRDGLRSGQIPPTYKQRLRLAVFAVKSALQCYETPWLPKLPSSRDIFFMQNGRMLDYDRPFLMARSERSDVAARKGKSKAVDDSIIQNPTLLAIGVLLIELLQGQNIDSLQGPGESLGDLLSLHTAALRLLTEVSRASSNYGTAVSRCIDGQIQGKDLDLGNEDDRHKIYCGIIALLEEDLNNS